MLRIIAVLALIVLLLGAAAVGGVAYVFWHYGRDLPDYSQLARYQPPVMTRVHAGDGRLLAEYAIEKRVFVPVNAIPKRVINAFLAAEDKTFFEHVGIDVPGIIAATLTNIRNYGQRRPVGASTITQQVAKNFLLTNEVSIERKIKEAILALRIEKTLSKNRILELYLNEIYLGFGSYGVAAAALNYFNKSLDELTVAEAAFLAALPKAPNNYNPITNSKAAKARRDWVIGRMHEDGHISAYEATNALGEPLVVRHRSETEFVQADYFAEEVRREIASRYGEEALYRGGLSVRTTLDPRLQEIARRTLRNGLIDYDRRHGWRGPVAHLDLPAESAQRGGSAEWALRLAQVPPAAALGNWRMAVVLEVDAASARIGFADSTRGHIPLPEVLWARPWKEGQEIGPPVRRVPDVLSRGDVVLVEEVKRAEDGTPYAPNTYGLRQVPDVQGALVAMDPHTGRVLAMVGGYGFERSQYNRATQAYRQPGSAFKPIVYLTALDAGLSPSSLILDAPIVIDQGPGLPKWKPKNYQSGEFYGPTTLRVGIEKSRNLMTVRLAQTIGIDKVAETAERLGIVDHLPRFLSMSLGAGETTLMRLTTAYSMLVNGGKKIAPALIDRIQDRTGRTVLRHDKRPCEGCRATFWTSQDAPEIPDQREQVVDPLSAYQMVSMLQGVVERGTARRVASVGKPLAGKTGTSNDNSDTWFVGFSPDLAVGVFVGFDNPRTLGPHETGGSTAAPIFRDFMAEALKDKPATPFRIPPGIRLVRVNAETGRVAAFGDTKVILEAFKPGNLPYNGPQRVLEGIGTVAAGSDAANDSDPTTSATGYAPAPAAPAAVGTGGLY